jgi:F-type H+-transporting ATPase subunit b
MAQPQPQPQPSMTGHEAPGGHGAGGGAFPPFQSNTFVSQLLWLALIFGLLYYLMAKVALPRIATILHDRSVRLAGDLDEAQRMRTEAETAGAAYERSLGEARARAKAIAQEARDALAAENDAKRKALEAQLAERLAASEAAISARTAEAMASVRGIAADAATAIIERLTGQAPERAAVEAALDRTLST